MTSEGGGGFSHRENGGRLRRFDSPEIDPSRAIGLRANHPAVIEGRTIFPSTVVSAEDSPRLLVSGKNNSKLGGAVTRGARAGWPIFQLTLEERATCPRTCETWASCYGNAVHLGRRHKVDEHLIPALAMEVRNLQRAHPQGFLVRVHTLGDFYSPEYVLAWATLLAENPALHVFGYTARTVDDEDPASRKIARTIAVLTGAMWDRFAIRTSASPLRHRTGTHYSVVVDQPPVTADPGRMIVCPAQLKQSECCGTCGLCWSAPGKTIAFLRHGMKRTTGPRAPKEAEAAPMADMRQAIVRRPEPIAPPPPLALPAPTFSPSAQAAIERARARALKAGPRPGSNFANAVLALQAALPRLFADYPEGAPAEAISTVTGLPYNQALRAAARLTAMHLARWTWGPDGQSKVLTPWTHPGYGVPTPEQAEEIAERMAGRAQAIPPRHEKSRPRPLDDRCRTLHATIWRLADHEGIMGERRSVISEAADIPLGTLHELFSRLRRAGLVEMVKDAQRLGPKTAIPAVWRVVRPEREAPKAAPAAPPKPPQAADVLDKLLPDNRTFYNVLAALADERGRVHGPREPICDAAGIRPSSWQYRMKKLASHGLAETFQVGSNMQESVWGITRFRDGEAVPPEPWEGGSWSRRVRAPVARPVVAKPAPVASLVPPVEAAPVRRYAQPLAESADWLKPERKKAAPRKIEAEAPALPAPARPQVVPRSAPLADLPADLADLPTDSLLSLRHGDCKWPLDDPGAGRMHLTRFCKNAAGDATYCPGHTRAASRGPRDA